MTRRVQKLVSNYTFFCARWKKKLFWRYKLWLSWKQCVIFSLPLSYVGGPNMWVSEIDHSHCICCHDMREIMNSMYFFLSFLFNFFFIIPRSEAIWSSLLSDGAARKTRSSGLVFCRFSSKTNRHRMILEPLDCTDRRWWVCAAVT